MQVGGAAEMSLQLEGNEAWAVISEATGVEMPQPEPIPHQYAPHAEHSSVTLILPRDSLYIPDTMFLFQNSG